MFQINRWICFSSGNDKFAIFITQIYLFGSMEKSRPSDGIFEIKLSRRWVRFMRKQAALMKLQLSCRPQSLFPIIIIIYSHRRKIWLRLIMRMKSRLSVCVQNYVKADFACDKQNICNFQLMLLNLLNLWRIYHFVSTTMSRVCFHAWARCRESLEIVAHDCCEVSRL